MSADEARYAEPLDVAAVLVGINLFVALMALCKCQVDATERDLLAMTRVSLHDAIPYLRVHP